MLYVESFRIKQQAAKEKQELTKRIDESKEEIKEIVEENKAVIPKKYMDHFKAEASRLYPDNAYEQKRYIESSINTYKYFNKISYCSPP
jgi:hypothetical protein